MVDSGGYHTSLLTTRQQLPLIGLDRRMNPRYAAFQSHYAFEQLFGMLASGNEKPGVENRVTTMRRRYGTPVPKAKNIDELNVSLRQCCGNEQSRSSTAACCRFRTMQPQPEKKKSLPPAKFTIADVLKLNVLVNLLEESRRNIYFVASDATGSHRSADRERTWTSVVHTRRCGAAVSFFFAVRYERRSLLLTSNRAFSDWGKIFQGESMTDALLDRLTRHCEIFEMSSERFRFRESMKRYQKARIQACVQLRSPASSQLPSVKPSSAQIPTAPVVQSLPRWIGFPR